MYSSLVSSLLSESDVSHPPQIKWATAHEEDATKAFMSDVASQHDGGLQGFRQCGLFIKPTTCTLLLHQMACFCTNVAVFQLLTPSVLTLYEMRIFISRTHLTESNSLKISLENPLETVPQILYPNASTNVGLWCLSWVFHCLETGWPPLL